MHQHAYEASPASQTKQRSSCYSTHRGSLCFGCLRLFTALSALPSSLGLSVLPEISEPLFFLILFFKIKMLKWPKIIVVCHHGKNKADKSKPILYTTHSHNIYVWRTRLMMCNVESVNLNAAIKMQVHLLLINKVNSLY